MYIFQSTWNTRPVLENSMKYIRSDVPTVISESEKNWLLSNGVTTVVDLRTDEERMRKPCPLIEDSRFTYRIFPITGGDTVPPNTEEVSRSYINMVDAKFEEMMDFLLKVGSNVLFFCNAGKDRTGIVSAVLLYKLGMPTEYIVDDYMKSKDNLKTLFTEFVRQHPSIDVEIITPHKRYIEEFLKWYIDRAKA